MTEAHGLRIVLVAAALIALLHGLLLKKLAGDAPWALRKDPRRPGRPHDGRPHPGLGAQFIKSREDDLREMFEFASQAAAEPNFRLDRMPVDWNRCDAPASAEISAPDMIKTPCRSGAEAAAYFGGAVVNQYADESPMNGGLLDGIGGYDSAMGFGGSLL